MLRIVEENLSGCINRGAFVPEVRYYVIETPINESGLCREFKTREEAEAYIKRKQMPDKDLFGQLLEARHELTKIRDMLYLEDDLKQHTAEIRLIRKQILSAEAVADDLLEKLESEVRRNG